MQNSGCDHYLRLGDGDFGGLPKISINYLSLQKNLHQKITPYYGKNYLETEILVIQRPFSA